MRYLRAAMVKHLAVLWLIGAVALSVATWACFALGVNSGTTSFVYLIVIVALSLWDSFLSSAVFSITAVSLLNFFFIPPIFTFEVQYESDIPMLGVFVLTSFVITGLVRRLQQTTATSKQQAQLLDLTHDTVVVRDSNDVIKFWNRGAERLYGWSRAEAVGKVMYQLLKTVFPRDLAALNDELRRTGHWEGEVVNTAKNGAEVVVASRWSLQRDAGGEPTGTLETNNDITERKRAEEALRLSQAAYLAEAQKLSLTGSFGWNVDSGDVFWSEQSFAILGFTPDVRPSNRLMLERVHPDDVEAVRQTINRVSHERGEFDIEFRLAMPDGAIKHIHAVGHAMQDALNAAQFVGALMDVTAAKQADGRLHEAQAQVAHVARVTSLGALSASIAHEVNQPLAAIVSHGEASLRWLHRDTPRLDEVESSIHHVIANGKRASEVVQRIRALTSKTGRRDSALDLNSLVEEVVPLVRNEAARNRALLRLDLAADMPAIQGDPIQLQQVMINLVINAIQAMASIDDRARAVVIRTRAVDNGHVLFEVEDTGPGIDPDHATELFEAFYTTKPGGMGMGLSICRSIIETHGGQISAVSRAPEPGAIFRCTLPTRSGS